jgi:hypothetical protein
LEWTMPIGMYILLQFGIFLATYVGRFYGHWVILWPFGIYFHILVNFTQKTLATLFIRPPFFSYGDQAYCSRSVGYRQ